MNGASVRFGGVFLALLACAARTIENQAPASTASPSGHARVWPDEPFRAERPATAETPVAPTDPAIDRFALENGLVVHWVARPGYPLVAMSLRFPGGTSADPVGKEGLSRLAMALLSEGSGSQGATLGQSQADLGARIWAGSREDESFVEIRAPSHNLAPALALAVGALDPRDLRAADLERIRSRHIASMRQVAAAPASLAAQLWPALLFGADHPYGKRGDEHSLAAVTLADCRRYAEKLGPRGAHLLVVGDVVRADLDAALMAVARGWKGSAPPMPRIPAPLPPRGSLFLVDVPGTDTSVIRVGRPLSLRRDRHDAPLTLMTQMLGGSFGSRLDANLRENKGHTAEISARNVHLRRAGYLTVTSSVAVDATVPALREIAREMTRTHAEEANAEELERERRAAVWRLARRFSTIESLLEAVGEIATRELPLGHFAAERALLTLVDGAAVRAAASEYLMPVRAKVLVVGDAARVRADLARLSEDGVFGHEGLVHLDRAGGRVAEPDAVVRP